MVSTRDGASVVRFESLAPTNKYYKNKLKLNAYETKTLIVYDSLGDWC